MQRNPKTLLDVQEDKNGALIFKAIFEDNGERLNEILQYYTNTNFARDGYNYLQFAAVHGRWKCALVLANDALNRKSVNKYFLSRAGLALLLAAEHNQEKIVEALLKLEMKFSYFTQHYHPDKILFEPKVSFWTNKQTKLWRDQYIEYTALHWAVKNNNPEMCKMFITLENTKKSILSGGTDHKVLKVKDKMGFNALNLAFNLNHLECAREIAKGMSILYVLEHVSDEIVCKIMLNDIQFGSLYSGNPSFKSSYIDGTFNGCHVESKIKLVLKHIFSLPIEDKIKAIDIALDSNTLLGGLINARQFMMSSTRKKIHSQLVNELKLALQNQQDLPIIEKQALVKNNLISISEKFNEDKLVSLLGANSLYMPPSQTILKLPEDIEKSQSENNNAFRSQI